MPLNHRQERFCRAFVQYGAAATAASEAGYAARSAKKQGWRLLRVGAIRQRIREVQAEIAEYHGRIDEVLMGKMEIVYQRALEDHQFYAAARAAELQAKFARQVANRRVERTVEAVALPGLALPGLALGGEAAGLGNGGMRTGAPKIAKFFAKVGGGKITGSAASAC